MNYFEYIEKAIRPHRIHARITKIEKRHTIRFSELDANRGLRFAAEMLRAERAAMIKCFAK